MNRSWSQQEVEAIVADYFEMLSKELTGVAMNKTEHRKRLAARLDERSHTAIENKHQNISSILIELGSPHVTGYKPLGNYQKLLFEVVANRLQSSPGLADLIAKAVGEQAIFRAVPDILSRLESPIPAGEQDLIGEIEPESAAWRRNFPRVDYLEREARNASLGLAGEHFAIAFERARLMARGRATLADRIQHVSVENGDGAGFDILSFEEDGRDRYIEVKTTAFGKPTPFFVTKNEVRFSRAQDEQFHLYRVFQFRKNPRLYSLAGSLEQSARLTATQFSGLPA
jgi:hypothetical protein